MRTTFSLLATLLFCTISLHAAESPTDRRLDSTLNNFPADAALPLREALTRAGANQKALLNVAEKLPQLAAKEQLPLALEAYAFLVSHMPEKDLTSLSEEILTNTLHYALKAHAGSPWSAAIPHDVFLNDVLPYASLDEVRENWRADFYDRFAARAWTCATPGEAARWLNATIFPELKVKYDQIRSTVNASPAVSIKEGKATCTGLSILLINACRACGIPARMAGIPSWKTPNTDAAGNHGGNHNWVEVWHAGAWHCLGASEISELDQTWFLAKCKDAVDGTQWQHSVYASTWKPTDQHFPLVWNIEDKSVPAVNVSDRYAPKK